MSQVAEIEAGTTEQAQSPAATKQENGDPPEVAGKPDAPILYMDGMTEEALARLKKMAPELIDDIDRDLCDKQCEFFDLINRTIGGDWAKTADVLEFALNWKPGGNVEQKTSVVVESGSPPPATSPTLQAFEPENADSLRSIDALKRLAEYYPREIDKIVDGHHDADAWSSDMFASMNTKMDRQGWTCVADVAEFIDCWKPCEEVPRRKPACHQVLEGLFDEHVGADVVGGWGETLDKLAEVLDGAKAMWYIPTQLQGPDLDSNNISAIVDCAAYCSERIKMIASEALYAAKHPRRDTSESDPANDADESAEGGAE